MRKNLSVFIIVLIATIGFARGLAHAACDFPINCLFGTTATDTGCMVQGAISGNTGGALTIDYSFFMNGIKTKVVGDKLLSCTHSQIAGGGLGQELQMSSSGPLGSTYTLTIIGNHTVWMTINGKIAGDIQLKCE